MGIFLLIVAIGGAGCRKNSAPTASSNDNTVEVSGTVKEEDPTEFTTADESVQIGGVNIAASSGYSISVFALSSNGKETLIFNRVFPTADFSFKSKVSKKYLRVLAIKLNTGGKFGAVLPPPTSDKLVSMTIDRTTSIGSMLLEIVSKRAIDGDKEAGHAIANQTLSVADILILAQSVRRTVDQQIEAKVPATGIDITILAKNLIEKSNEKFDALAAEGVSNSEASKKISETTYETVFGSYAADIPAGILAYCTNTNLGTSAAATTEVAYEAIKAANTPTFNTVNAAFRSEADTYRTAATIEDAVLAEKQVSINYAARYRMCTVDDPTNCISAAYTPPPPPQFIAGKNPVISQVSSTTTNGSYKIGQIITVTVTYSEPVIVTGVPKLALATGLTDRAAYYVSGSGTNTLTFHYEVKTGDISADLDYRNRSALSLNGGSVKGSSGMTAILTLPTPGGIASIAGQKAIVIDTSNPSLAYISISPTSPGNDATPDIVVNNSEISSIVLYSNSQCSTAVSSSLIGILGDNTITTNTLVSSSVTTIYGQAIDAAGNASDCTLLTTYELTPSPTSPGAFSISSATNGNTQSVVTWGGASGATSYTVKYGTSSGSYGTTVSTAATSPTTITGLSNGTTYYIMVTAVNASGSTNASSQVTATPAAGGEGGQNIGDLNLTYWIQNGSAAGYMYGPVSSSSWTDNASFAPSLSSGYFVVDSALTLGKDSAPWVAVTSTSSGGDFRGDVISTVNLGGSSFSGNAFTVAANLITGNSPPRGSVSIASVNDGTGYRIVPATGWSLLNPPYTHRYVFNVLPSSGSAFSGMGDWIAGGELHPYDDDGAMGNLASASKAGVLHQVGVRKATSTDPFHKIIYGTYSNPGGGWAWSAPSLAALNKKSDASTDCRDATMVALDFDRNNSAHGLHMVYMCEYEANGSIQWQIVHLWNNGSSWISQMAVSSTDIPYINYPSGNRLGFSVHNGKALLVYWSADGSLQAKYGTFNSGNGQYDWSASATQIATKDASVQYFLDPQVAIASDGTGRVAYLYRENHNTDSVIAVAHDSTGTWQTLDNLKRAAALRLGQGLGITGLAGNSEQ